VRFALIACAALAACGSPGGKSEWERENEDKLAPEEGLTLPGYPRELVEFPVAATSEFRFFVDPASLSVGADGIVRYTLVARSSAGAQNVSYEGMRCATGEVRVYAVGRGRDWIVRESEWRAIRPGWHSTLYREYFCPVRQPIASREEGVRALERGGVPFTRGLSEDIPRGGGAR
jgi:hypothetical protein